MTSELGCTILYLVVAAVLESFAALVCCFSCGNNNSKLCTMTAQVSGHIGTEGSLNNTLKKPSSKGEERVVALLYK